MHSRNMNVYLHSALNWKMAIYFRARVCFQDIFLTWQNFSLFTNSMFCLMWMDMNVCSAKLSLSLSRPIHPFAISLLLWVLIIEPWLLMFLRLLSIYQWMPCAVAAALCVFVFEWTWVYVCMMYVCLAVVAASHIITYSMLCDNINYDKITRKLNIQRHFNSEIGFH